MKLKTIDTVNVIEYFEGTIQQILAFDDDKAGNMGAEKAFKMILMEHGIGDMADQETYLEDGTYSDQNGYEIYLVHST